MASASNQQQAPQQQEPAPTKKPSQERINSAQNRTATAPDPSTEGVEQDDADESTPLLSGENARSRDSWTRTIVRIVAILVPTIAFWLLLYRFFPLSRSSSPADDLASSLASDSLLSNGTHKFRRTVIMISLDGAKPVYLDAGLAPNLQSLGTKKRGRRAHYMKPIFPTLTFPNHWSILTGLHASSHGIVANDFTLGSTSEQFWYTNPNNSWNSSWWLGDPIWSVAEKAGLNSAVLMWPGPPVTAAGVRPSYFQKYESAWTLNHRLSKMLEWIDVQEVEERASLICAYVPDIDQAAHKFGPSSIQARRAVRSVDIFIEDLRRQLVEKRKLGKIVDIVVVSDHGMTKTSNDKLIFLDDVLGRELYGKIEHRDGWPLAGLRFHGSEDEQRDCAWAAYEKLLEAAGKGFDVYWREDLPARFRLYSSAMEDRLAPLWIIPKLGWSITTHPELASFHNRIYAPIGNHGYDNEEEDMRAIFVAAGPSFAKSKESKDADKTWNMKGFANIEVHNLVSRILGVPARKRADTDGDYSFWDAHLKSGL